MKSLIDFAMIVFNGNYVLRQNLETIYPFANKIIITEGPVKHYQRLGFNNSTDGTIETIRLFPDPDHKIVFISGQWSEKDEMVNVQNQHYTGNWVWHVDCDEIYRPEDMVKIIDYLESHPDCYSMGFKLCSFFGGFDRHISGFEETWDTIRIQKIIPGQSKWLTHRPPTMIWPPTGKTCKEMGHVNFQTTSSWGIKLYHYSFVFPKQVRAKADYYKSMNSAGIIDLWNLYVPWMRSPTEAQKLQIEQPTLGVQVWIPSRRGPAFTKAFNGKHPDAIEKCLPELRQKIEDERKFLGV